MDRKEYMKQYKLKNKDKIKLYQAEYNKDYVAKNKDKIKSYQAEYKEKIVKPKRKYNDEYRENFLNKKRKSDRKYYLNNKEAINEKKRLYEKDKRNNNPFHKLKNRLRSMIGNAIDRKGYIKNSKTEQILGCSFDEFKNYIESKWEPWMSWENYGLYKKDCYNVGWDIDHIIPISSAKTEEDLYRFNYYTNLQPLCSKINRDEKRAYPTTNSPQPSNSAISSQSN